MPKKIKKGKFEFGIQFQIDLITLMTESISFLLLCKKFVKKEFFSTSRLEYFVENIYNFHSKYNLLVDRTFLNTISRDKLDKFLVKRILRKRLIKELFIRDKVEDFVKRSIFMELYINVGETYNKNPYTPDQAYELLNEGVNKIHNINMHEDGFTFLFKDFEDRIVEREHRNQTNKNFTIPTGIRALDRRLGGGIKNSQVFMYFADAKAGKSIGLMDAGINAVRRYFGVMHFQLEGSKQECLDRYDSAFLNYPISKVSENIIPKELIDKMESISERRRFKDLIIRNYVEWDSCSIIDIERDYLEVRSRGFDPKLIIIDYMDLMKARKGYGEERFRQQSVIRDIKSFAAKYDVAIWTATQSNRAFLSDDNEFILTSKNLAEDYGKVRAIDALISINVTNEELKNGVARLWIDSVRSGEGKEVIFIRRDLKNMQHYIGLSKRPKDYVVRVSSFDKKSTKVISKRRKKKVSTKNKTATKTIKS